MASTGGRCIVSTGEPQQSSQALLATWLGSLSMFVQAEPVKLVTGKLMLVLLPVDPSPGSYPLGDKSPRYRVKF